MFLSSQDEPPVIDLDLAETALQDGGDAAGPAFSYALNLLNNYAVLFTAAFVVTLLATPLIRRLAIAGDVIDKPDASRKAHTFPVAYLGGVAVFLGMIVAIGLSYALDDVNGPTRPIPIAIVLGMVAIMFTGLADDIWGWDPRLKIAGQLVAAAALAIEDVGVNVARGVLRPLADIVDPWLGTHNLAFEVPLPFGDVTVDLMYWTGTAIIAIFVLGGCNATNLIDGLDGLLSGVVAVVAVGLLAISVMMVFDKTGAASQDPSESLAGARVALCLALLGAVLGFLPHNFNPATIFLGDCGSLMLGYLCVVIILMFGENGQTHLVFAGLIVFSVPIMDTTLAMIRRWLAGVPMSAADNQHIHHQLKNSLGGVRRAVLALYGISMAFALIGMALAAVAILTDIRVRVVYAIALVLFGSIGVIAVKAAQRQRLQAEARRMAARQAPPQSAVDSTDGAAESPATSVSPESGSKPSSANP